MAKKWPGRLGGIKGAAVFAGGLMILSLVLYPPLNAILTRIINTGNEGLWTHNPNPTIVLIATLILAGPGSVIITLIATAIVNRIIKWLNSQPVILRTLAKSWATFTSIGSGITMALLSFVYICVKSVMFTIAPDTDDNALNGLIADGFGYIVLIASFALCWRALNANLDVTSPYARTPLRKLWKLRHVNRAATIQVTPLHAQVQSAIATRLSAIGVGVTIVALMVGPLITLLITTLEVVHQSQ